MKATKRQSKASPPVKADFHIFTTGELSDHGETGAGICIFHNFEARLLKYGGYETRGTKDRAEIRALYEALKFANQEAKSGNACEIFSQSYWAVMSVTDWAYGWRTRGWHSEGIDDIDLIRKAHCLYTRTRRTTNIRCIANQKFDDEFERARQYAFRAVHEKARNVRTRAANNILYELFGMI